MILLERKCLHPESYGCKPNDCKENLITRHDMEVIKTGFNIFILLINFKEIDSNHHNLDNFSDDLDFDFKRYAELQKKFKKETKNRPHKGETLSNLFKRKSVKRKIKRYSKEEEENLNLIDNKVKETDINSELVDEFTEGELKIH